ncbi:MULTISPECIES: OmpA family protein [unclassified Colwellia]|jgi:outer membrane protein OmpA-like peptidoglycan-associated protein|uniref:OmpA family protein n=1 Tax=unclassified Colwellia TaxID=196834 RepID=UPI0015F590B9|nr:MULTISPECIES: OmpA family protein [unclassified Colwellia]MBA6251021.1 OmpA family protein [Colwellia sp. MB3u-55]MBA6399446.1 OmpA family protein [Colwellia sp. BRX10-4]
MKKIITTASAILLLQACTTFDPYTGESKTSKTAIGATVGASLAAVIAFIDNKDKDSRTRNKRILAAASGGAAIGGGIGYYMDTQEAKLRKQLRDSGVSIVRDGNKINLVMPGNITFASNSSNINSNFTSVLDSVSLVLEEYNQTIIVVSGHTDSSGSAQHNQKLSEDRAGSVANYLRGQKILSDRLETVGFGETQPAVTNKTAAGRELNRRVEITLLPIEQS